MMESGLGNIVANLPTLSFLMKDSSWIRKLSKRGSSWSNLFRFSSWRSSDGQISDEHESGSGSQAVQTKQSDPTIGISIAISEEELPDHHMMGSKQSEKELLKNLRLSNLQA